MLSNFGSILSILLVFEAWRDKKMTQSAAQCWNSAFDVKSSSIFDIPMDTSLTHVCLSAWLFLPKGMIQFWDSYKLWLSSSFLTIWLVSTDSQLFWTVQNDSNKWLKSVLNSLFLYRNTEVFAKYALKPRKWARIFILFFWFFWFNSDISNFERKLRVC